MLNDLKKKKKAKDSIHLLYNCHVLLRAKARICELIAYERRLNSLYNGLYATLRFS